MPSSLANSRRYSLLGLLLTSLFLGQISRLDAQEPSGTSLATDTDAAVAKEESAAAESLLAPYREAAEKRWTKDIEAFDERNANETHEADSILVIGSSSVRRWDTIARDLSPYRPIQRGYGGAKFTDMAVFAERIITPHSFRALVMFVGNGVVGNEDDHTPEQIESLARYIVSVAHRHQPGAPVFLIEITPCEKRFDAWYKIRKVNAALREVALTTPHTYFIPTASLYLNPEGTPRSELFVEDKLHLNESGYRLWSTIIRRRLDETFRMMEGN